MYQKSIYKLFRLQYCLHSSAVFWNLRKIAKISLQPTT